MGVRTFHVCQDLSRVSGPLMGVSICHRLGHAVGVRTYLVCQDMSGVQHISWLSGQDMSWDMSWGVRTCHESQDLS